MTAENYLKQHEIYAEGIFDDKDIEQAIINLMDGYVNDPERLTEHNANVVSGFIEHCKENDILIPDSIFESFFGHNS